MGASRQLNKQKGDTIMKWNLDRHIKSEHIHEDKRTHRINYIETTMLPDGRLFYLTMGAHLTNTAYICLGVHKNKDIIKAMNLQEELDKNPWMANDEVELMLAKSHGIISIHAKHKALYHEPNRLQVISMRKLRDDGHITEGLYQEIKEAYHGRRRNKVRRCNSFNGRDQVCSNIMAYQSNE